MQSYSKDIDRNIEILTVARFGATAAGLAAPSIPESHTSSSAG